MFQPVPRFKAVKVLLVWVVTLPKSISVIVLLPLPFAVPLALMTNPFKTFVPDEAVVLRFNVPDVPAVPAKFCVIVPVPEVKVKFLLAATVTSPLSVFAPVLVANVPEP